MRGRRRCQSSAVFLPPSDGQIPPFLPLFDPLDRLPQAPHPKSKFPAVVDCLCFFSGVSSRSLQISRFGIIFLQEAMPTATISSILTLLDDENEQVQEGLQKALLDFNGDATDDLVAAGLRLPRKQAKLLSKSLRPGRRTVIREEWAYPARQLDAVDGDWESLEALLRLLSDFLHDGITMRQSLSDELDLLSETATGKVHSPMDLAKHLFKTTTLTGNRLRPFDIRNSDLAWCIQEGESNPLGLSLIYMLVGNRLGIPVFGCNYPGHFLSLIDHEGEATIIDPFHNGRATPVRQLIKDHPEISKDAQKALKQPCTLGEMLSRILANLHYAFAKVKRNEDGNLVEELMLTVRS